MAIAYGLIFALSLIMPPLYFAFIRKKKKHHPYGRHNFLHWIVLGLNG